VRFKKIISLYNYLILYSLVILLFNIFFLKIPLINVFGYEFAVANSVLLTILSGLYFISFKKKRPVPAKHDIKPAAIVFSAFLIIPFLVTVINSFFTGFCSFWDGILFYLVITSPSVMIGGSTGLFAVFNFKRFPGVFFVIILILILLIPLGEFYFNPQVYFYNPVIGFLSGTIYDEGLIVDLKLTIYRFLNVLFFGSILLFLLGEYSGKIKIRRRLLNIIAAVIPVIFIFLSPHLGYSTTYGVLENKLNKAVTTSNFEIYFSPEISDNYIKLISLHHEYYYNELKDFLKTEPSQKIKSYIFHNRQQKKKLFGTANADVAKPWLYSIFITYDNYNTSLKHELAHCFSAEFGSGPFRIAHKINPYLIEGIATASNPFYDENSIDYMASLAYHHGYKINFDQMFDFSGFFTQLSALSYIYAGSFTKFLIDSYGIEKYKRFYGDLNFEKIYDVSLNNILKEWEEFLSDIETGESVHKANYYFGRKSIFHKVCPRYISSRLEKGWGLYSEEKYEKAEELFNSILEKEMNYSALTGLVSCLSRTDRKKEAVSLLENSIIFFEGTAYFYNLELQLGDMYAETEDFFAAGSLYNKLAEQNPAIRLFYISKLRSSLAQHDSTIYSYLTGGSFDKYMILKELNSKVYKFESFPVLINLSSALNEEYELFIRQFDKTIQVNDFLSSYGVYSLSQYMLENLDFIKARRMAALAMRYAEDENYNKVFLDNFIKMNWMFNNADSLLNKIILPLNESVN
jgi:hypothetical protein